MLTYYYIVMLCHIGEVGILELQEGAGEPFITTQQDSGATAQARMSCLIALKREKDERRWRSYRNEYTEGSGNFRKQW